MIRKGLAVVVIILFISVSVPSSGFGAENHCLINDSIGYFNSIMESKERGVNVTLNGMMGENGWYVSCVTITFTVNGEVDYIMYKLDDDTEWQEYTGLFLVTEDGEHTLCWYYVDNEGNQSEVECIEFKIDQTPPTIELIAEEIGDNMWLLTAMVSDETSGVAKVEFYVNDEFLGEVTEAPYEWTYDNASSGDIAQAIVYDNAGNSKLSEPPHPPPPPPPILFIGSIKNLDVNNESISFHANVVLILYFYVMPVEIIIDENVTLENDYKGFVGKRFIFARYNYWF